jgi:hypothetical protein
MGFDTRTSCGYSSTIGCYNSSSSTSLDVELVIVVAQQQVVATPLLPQVLM